MSDEKAAIKLSVNDRAIEAWLAATEDIPMDDSEVRQVDPLLRKLLGDLSVGRVASDEDDEPSRATGS